MIKVNVICFRYFFFALLASGPSRRCFHCECKDWQRNSTSEKETIEKSQYEEWKKSIDFTAIIKWQVRANVNAIYGCMVCVRFLKEEKSIQFCIVCQEKYSNALVFRWISFYELALVQPRSQQSTLQNHIKYYHVANIQHIHEYWHVHKFVWRINVFATACFKSDIISRTVRPKTHMTFVSLMIYEFVRQKTPMKAAAKTWSKKKQWQHTGTMNRWTARNWPLIWIHLLSVFFQGA